MSKKLNIIIENTFTPSKEECKGKLNEIKSEYPDRDWIIKPAVHIHEVKRKITEGYCVFEVVED